MYCTLICTEIRIFTLLTTAPCSRINAYFATLIWFILTCGKKNIRHIYTLFYHVFVILLSATLWYGYTLANVVWLVLVRTGPSCPCAHFNLTFVTPFSWLDCLQTPSLSFPWVLFGLAALILLIGAAGIGLGILGHTYAHISQQDRLYVLYMYKWAHQDK
jgi:hypothetical protein